VTSIVDKKKTGQK